MWYYSIVMAEQELITISEAAEILGVSVDTLRRWDKSGKLSPIKTSGAGYRLYDGSQIELFLNNLFPATLQDVRERLTVKF